MSEKESTNDPNIEEVAKRITGKAMPSLLSAWDRIARSYGLTSDELWTVKKLQVEIEELEGRSYDFELVAEAYKQGKEKGIFP